MQTRSRFTPPLVPKRGRSRTAVVLRVAFASTVLFWFSPSAADEIWIEGESARDHDFVSNRWYDDVAKDALSGGAWLSHYSKERGGTAHFDFTVKRGGEHSFWIRCNHFRSGVQYRFGRGNWVSVDLARVREGQMISAKPDHRFIGWVDAGKVSLRSGKQRVFFRIQNSLANHGAIDCFVLDDGSFVPSGLAKPGSRSGPGKPSEWFPVIPREDEFSERSVIDMSGLLHRPAGKLGFLERRGAALQFERASAPQKFWGAGANARFPLSRESQATRARYLAKHGINMVRKHPVFDFLGPLEGGRFDAKKIDALDWWFAELKKNGIYSTWSVFYPLRIRPDDGYPPELYAELDKGKTTGVVHFSRLLQNLQLRYLQALLRHVNPYTGLAYRDDPALAVLEIHNEDCIFFHNPLNSLASGKMPEHARVLRTEFCRWAKARYKTTPELRRAWGTNESLEDGELKLHGAWELDGKKKDARKGDFIRFLTELEHGFYARRIREVRELGFRGVTVTTAWRGGGAAADAANLYCDTAADMIDRHNYFGGGAGRHRIVPGRVRTATHLDRPGSGLLAMGLYQIEDRPFATSEWSQLPPNEWKAEAAPLIAFYGMGLQGWDASFHFLNGEPRIGDGWPGLRSYSTDTPHYIGQFPALSFALLKGHIREADIAVARRVTTEELFSGLDPIGQDFTGGGHDQKSVKGTRATPLDALAIGRVTAKFRERSAAGKESESIDLDRYRRGDVIRSTTGELIWNVKERVIRLGTPKTQAIIGFAGGTVQKLPAASVIVDTKFVSIIFTPLDDAPLVDSGRILLTALARDRQSGAEYSASGEQLETVGRPPLLLEPVEARIRLRGAPINKVNVLDIYGVPTGETAEIDRGALKIDGRYRTYYYEIVR